MFMLIISVFYHSSVIPVSSLCLIQIFMFFVCFTFYCIHFIIEIFKYNMQSIVITSMHLWLCFVIINHGKPCSVYTRGWETMTCGLWARSSPPPVSVNKSSWEHSLLLFVCTMPMPASVLRQWSSVATTETVCLAKPKILLSSLQKSLLIPELYSHPLPSAEIFFIFNFKIFQYVF